MEFTYQNKFKLKRINFMKIAIVLALVIIFPIDCIISWLFFLGDSKYMLDTSKLLINKL